MTISFILFTSGDMTRAECDLLKLKAKPYFEKCYVVLPSFDIKDVHSIVAALMYDNARYWALVDCPSRVILKWVALDAVRDTHILMCLQKMLLSSLLCNKLTWQPFDFFFDGQSQVMYKNTHFA